MKKFIRILFRGFVALFLVVALFLTVVIAFQIPLDLTRFKTPIETIASKALKRSVRIDESIVISTSTSPYFTIEGLVIENPDTFTTKNFLAMEKATIQVDLLPLLKKKLHIPQVTVHGLDITLEENAAGKTNWIFGDPKTPETSDSKDKVSTSEPQETPKAAPAGTSLEDDSLVVEKLDLQKISLAFHRPDLEEPATFHLETCLGTMVPGQPLHLDIDGKVMDFDYLIDVSIASLAEFLTENRSWVAINASIADTAMTFSGNVDLTEASRSMVVKTQVTGQNLASFNDLFQLDLPPFADYTVDTTLHIQPRLFELKELLIKTGSSSLQGQAKLAKEQEMTSVELQLTSPLVQINDFVFDDWNWTEEAEEDEGTEQQTEVKEETTEQDSPKEKNKKIFSPETLAKFNATLGITAQEVLSGEDFLGSGNLEASLQEGRLEVAPLFFKLPGGKIEMSASIKPGKEKSEAELKVDIENFDIGIMVRRSKPESDMGGIVNLAVDLSSQAASMSELLANGNGYFDFSGNLENFGAGILDLWAVNLVAAIVRSADEGSSELNCAVGRWTVSNGTLTPDAFFIDTSKIRICAKGQVDFKEEKIDLTVGPKAKKAEFFSLATPLAVQGHFSDINIGVKDGGLVGTVIRFVASPVTVPLKRTFSNKIPADGADVCSMVLGPQDRSEIEVPMCDK